MAIITTYPTIQPEGGDLVLLSDVSENGNPTKTASVNSILSLTYSAPIDLFQKDIKLTAAQMLSLNGGNTIELIPAPGAGKILIVMNALINLDFNSQAYNFATSGMSDTVTLALGATELINDNGFFTSNLNLGADTYFLGDPVSTSVSTQLPPNSALNLISTAGVTVSQGDSPVKVSLIYRVVDLNF